VFQPTRETLAEAAESMRCHHDLLQFPLPQLARARAGGRWTQEHDDATHGAGDADADGAGAFELVAASTFEMLEMVLGEHVNAVPRVSVCISGGVGVDHPPELASRPGVCEECIRSRAAAQGVADTTYVGASIKVEKVKTPPSPPTPTRAATRGAANPTTTPTPSPTAAATAAAAARAAAAPPVNGERAPPQGTRTSVRQRAAAATAGPSEWWKVQGTASKGIGGKAGYGGGGGGGRAVSFTVDASYTVWQLKLIILERMVGGTYPNGHAQMPAKVPKIPPKYPKSRAQIAGESAQNAAAKVPKMYRPVVPTPRRCTRWTSRCTPSPRWGGAHVDSP
jgi:hypothetical protein